MTNCEYIKEQLKNILNQTVDGLTPEELYVFLYNVADLKQVDTKSVNDLFAPFDKVFDNITEKEKDEYIESGHYQKDFIDWLEAQK